MSRLSIKLSHWSAVMSAILTVGWGIGLTMAMIFFPLPAWTNLAGLVTAVQPASLVAATLTQVAAFLLGPLSVILLCSLHDYSPGGKKILRRIGLCCIITTMALGSQMYFVHFNVMRLIAFKRALTGLEQFVEWNPESATAASGVLAWTFFGGLALLFVAPIFSGGRLEQRLRYTALVCGSCAILGVLGFLFGITILMLVYFLAYLVAGTTLYVLESLPFRRLLNGAPLKVSLPESVR